MFYSCPCPQAIPSRHHPFGPSLPEVRQTSVLTAVQNLRDLHGAVSECKLHGATTLEAPPNNPSTSPPTMVNSCWLLLLLLVYAQPHNPHLAVIKDHVTHTEILLFYFSLILLSGLNLNLELFPFRRFFCTALHGVTPFLLHIGCPATGTRTTASLCFPFSFGS